MTVVSNTSPLNYLVLVDLQHVLPALFRRILIPDAVWRELSSLAAPQQVKSWLDTAPNWLETQVISQVPAGLEQLDPGEREAIALAESVGATLVLLDEKKARQPARERSGFPRREHPRFSCVASPAYAFVSPRPAVGDR